jgi:hypothetical protein
VGKQDKIVLEAEKEAKPYMDPDDPRSVLPVSEYGQTNIEEAFAEAFRHYVLGKDMTRGQIESFRSVLASLIEGLNQKVVNRFLYACN